MFFNIRSHQCLASRLNHALTEYQSRSNTTEELSNRLCPHFMESCLLKVTMPIRCPFLSALEATDVTSSHLPLPHVRHPTHGNVPVLLPLGHSSTETHETSSSQQRRDSTQQKACISAAIRVTK